MSINQPSLFSSTNEFTISNKFEMLSKRVISDKTIPESKQSEVLEDLDDKRAILERTYQKVITQPDHLNQKDTSEMKLCEKESLKTLNLVGKESHPESDELNDLISRIRFDIEKIQRIVTLFAPSDLLEFERTLMWMYEQGQEEELGFLQRISKKPPYKSDLLNITIEAIANRQPLQKYRIFCSEDDIKKITPKIDIIRNYKHFVIVLATTAMITEIKARYAVEILPPVKFTSETILPNSVSIKQTNPEETMRDHRDQVIYFNLPILEDWKRQIETLGATILRPIGRREIVASVPNKEIIKQIKSNVEGVEDIRPYTPTIRVNPQNLQNLHQTPANATEQDLKKAIAQARIQAAKSQPNDHQRKNTVPGILIADFFTEEDRNQGAQELENQGIRITNRPGKKTLVVDVSKDANALNSFMTITRLTGLQSVEEKTIPRLFNEQARYVIGKNVIPSNPHPQPTDLSLTGKGEIIAIADTGLDTGDRETIHPDFQGRVNLLTSYPITTLPEDFISNFGHQDPPIDQYSGHGTHVAGSALGNGQVAQELGLPHIPAGMATEANLIFQAIEQVPQWTLDGTLFYIQNYGDTPPKSGLYGIPENLSDLFEEAYHNGARIHSNSWGGGEFGEYGRQSEQLDEFVWEHKDFLVLVAAGNDGQQRSSAIGIDQKSVTPPGTAKNCLTVGASENQREGEFTDTYGQWWPDKFPHDPIKSDNMANSLDDIAAFSSRGPCEDGRRKPDVIAPGTFILSTRSSQIANNNFAWGAFTPAKRHYMYMGGTSMATPLVAGCAALVRQYLREQENIIDPSAALVKGILIHSAQLINYRYKHPSSEEWPDNEQGWGRINLSQVLNPPAPTKVKFIDEFEGLQTDESRQYQLQVRDLSVPLKVTLVYSDYPGNELVNNLNLKLSSPTAKDYLGNDFEETGKPDIVNNVEGIVVESPEIGEWTVTVIGSDVNEDTQDYALVISGGLGID
ncbi:S8 family serine peptidase [Aphanothece sacrum]|uniref:Peptidase S8/S53 domain-containing protein n=1 Tax=Aphanothece sacrum FPU1 TaxID=1920663 RepID=A0A401ILH9_APHSA|nr:S8 family serine peptidase [Aphanothece sacrum]GBF82113.1 hypothetical protein AsFPU1_3540 [Aphanothece sacrum FPU1]GBF85047.1 hypothetical protein AsFPU3_2103 [Aphanothece sacrum FPU3]